MSRKHNKLQCSLRGPLVAPSWPFVAPSWPLRGPFVASSWTVRHLRKSYAAVAGRRPAFPSRTNGVDLGLTLHFESLPWQESRKAALRIGCVIVQKLAATFAAPSSPLRGPSRPPMLGAPSVGAQTGSKSTFCHRGIDCFGHPPKPRKTSSWLLLVDLRGPSSWSLLVAPSWPLRGPVVAPSSPLRRPFVASSWSLRGPFVAPSWPLRGLFVAPS